jgi:hypothetical protein
MRMNVAVARVDHQPLKVGIVNQLLQQPLPDALIPPADEPPVRVAPTAVTPRQASPRHARPQDPENRIDELPVVLRDAAPMAFPSRKMWLKQRPRPIINIMPPNRFHVNSMSYRQLLNLTLTRDYTV